MIKIGYDNFMNALREANPELANVVNFVKDQNSENDRIRTFEDCARVEQDIMNKLNNVNPFKG